MYDTLTEARAIAAAHPPLTGPICIDQSIVRLSKRAIKLAEPRALPRRLL